MSLDMFPDSAVEYLCGGILKPADLDLDFVFATEEDEDERPWAPCRDLRCEHAHQGPHEHRAGLADLPIPARGQE